MEDLEPRPWVTKLDPSSLDCTALREGEEQGCESALGSENV
jgi:hypothetical protein